MTEAALVRDLAVVMAVSGLVTAIFHHLRQPVVLGYLLAGVLIGPHTPPFALVSDAHSIETLAELGVIFLLFSIGLEFSFRKLRRVGGVSLLGAALEIPLLVWLGFSAGRLLGWNTMDSVFLGAILSVSSTTIIAKALMELGQTREEYARISVGILIVEDLAAILMLVVLTALARAGEVSATEVAVALGRVTLFVVALSVVGLLLVPRVLHLLARMPAREVLTVSVVGICFAFAILARELGFSVALGAFLAGAVMGESRHVHDVEERIESIRDMFSAIFFVAVGLQIDPRVLVDNAPLVLALSMLTVGGKLLACSFATIVSGYSAETAVRVGMALGQIGEFSFIIAGLGRSAGVISPEIYPLTVAVSAATTLSTAYQIGSSPAIVRAAARLVPKRVAELHAFYTRQLATPSRGTPFGDAAARAAIVRGLVCAVLLVAILVGAERAIGALRRAAGLSGMSKEVAETLVWPAAGVLAIPVLIAAWRSGGSLAASLVRRFPARGAAERLLAETFRFAFFVVGGAIFLALASPILPSGPPLLVGGLVVAATAAFFGRTVWEVQATAERVLRTAFSAHEPDHAPRAEQESEKQKRRELDELVSSKYGFEVVLEDFVVPFHPTGLNRKIRELELRKRTGATIAAIYREESPLVNPEPEVSLAPGDILVLLGSPAQVQAAMAELGRLAAHPAEKT